MNRSIFLLDSGAFSAWTQKDGGVEHKLKLKHRAQELYKEVKVKTKVAEMMGIPYGVVLGLLSDVLSRTVTLENYAKFVLENGKLFRGGVFSLDVIGSDKGSYENWLELRRLGVETIPVHHIGDDEFYLKKYLDECDYIGLGAIAKLETNARLIGLDHIWKEYLTNTDGSPRLRIHGLGLTENSIILRYPWYSVDSTRAVMSASHGQIFVPNFLRGQPDFSEIHQVSVSDQDRDHTVGKTGSFFALPPIAQRQLIEYIHGCGYSIDVDLVGRSLNQLRFTRKKGLPKYSAGLNIFEEDSEIVDPVIKEGMENNVSQYWVPRFGLNLMTACKFFEYWQLQGKDVKMYNVCGNKNVLDHFLHMTTSNPPRILTNFAALMRATGTPNLMFKSIQEAVRGKWKWNEANKEVETPSVRGF